MSSGRDDERALKAERFRRVGISVAGLGRIGRLHAENLALRTESALLVAVADIAEPRARSTGEELGVPWSSRIADVISHPRTDAIVIATPTATHGLLVEAAADAGKHVFCEKPLAPDFHSAAQAVDAARQARLKLQVGLHMRFDPSFATLSERIRAGEIGDLYSFRATLRDRCPPERAYLEESGGLLLDGGFHTFDVARYLGGEVDEVVCFGAALSDSIYGELGDVDNAAALLRFRNGAIGVIEHSRVAGYGFDCRVEVVGSRKSARVTADRKNDIEWLVSSSMRTDHVATFVERFPAAYRLELEAFARAVRDDAPVRATGEDALAATVLCEAAQQSLTERRAVRVEHPDRWLDGLGEAGRPLERDPSGTAVSQ